MGPARDPALLPDWTIVVEHIRDGDSSQQAEGMKQLFQCLSKGIRFYFWRQTGAQDLDDKVAQLFVTIVEAIQKGKVLQPERLMGFVRTVAKRQMAAHISDLVYRRQANPKFESLVLTLKTEEHDPERIAMDGERQQIFNRMLVAMNPRDREILIRFYREEQEPEQIMREMRLTFTQYRLIKTRAKARLEALGKARLAQRLGFRLK